MGRNLDNKMTGKNGVTRGHEDGDRRGKPYWESGGKVFNLIGSYRSFCTKSLLQRLKAYGKPVSLFIDTLTHEEQRNSLEIDVEVKGTQVRSKCILLLQGVLVIDRLPPSLGDSVASTMDVMDCKHLREIISPVSDVQDVDLQIGQDCPRALIPLECRTGRDGAPFAMRTQLGWTVNGPTAHENVTTLAVMGSPPTLPPAETRLAEQVKRFWEVEMTFLKATIDAPVSREDKRVVQLWSSTGLRKRLLRDAELKLRYVVEIENLITKGFAEKVPKGELTANPGRTWHLPHHPVLIPNKPEKTRMVFDCPATFANVSLNSEVLQGPDFNNKCFGVLISFRQELNALTADIEAMFHQVKVHPEHKDALRFLWRHTGIKEVDFTYDNLPTERALEVMWNLEKDQFASAQLYHFCDASESASAVVTYLRTVDKEGRIDCSFVCGRARLAPLKQQTIPRLELCAAVLAAHTDTTVRRRNAHAETLPHFVANRESAIREVTDMRQWRHVSSKQNPVDDATRGVTKEPLQCLWEKYSSWLQFQRGVAWIRRVINVLKDKTPTANITVLSVLELRQAKTAILE
ncbi:uncharacterized protein LOC121865953 [Homarus americanus]|uniref:uncharacterized protein LOC121865953 n=1 Tax=Homarus americanus TaxID=6706 RepID=UPI001C440427|nr:uncharacterized protein LOC121865953 [Homarus americanus]